MFGLSCSDIGLGAVFSNNGVIYGIIVGLVVAAILFVGINLLRINIPFFSSYEADANNIGDLFYRLLLKIPFGTVLLEEFAFRGLLISLLFSYGLGSNQCVLISSAIFGLWHIGFILRTVPRVQLFKVKGIITAFGILVIGFIGSLIFGFLRIKTDNLLSPILVHWIINVSTLIIMFHYRKKVMPQ